MLGLNAGVSLPMGSSVLTHFRYGGRFSDSEKDHTIQVGFRVC